MKVRKTNISNASNNKDTQPSKTTRINRKRIVLLTFAILFIIGAIYIYQGNTSIEVTNYTIEDALIPQNFNDTVIVHISDLHNKEFGKNQKDLLSIIYDIQPDIIAVTGDMIDSRNTDIDIAMDFINGAVNIASTYFVVGNHEMWSREYSILEKKLIDAGVVVLRDEIEEIKKNDDSIYLVGLDDPAGSHNEQSYSMKEKLTRLTKETKGYTVLLSHRPEEFASYVDEANLVLSGHTHGGQIRLPFIGAVIAPDQGFFPKYSDGLYKESDTTMIISRGLGSSVIPIRINNPAEIVVVTLKAKVD